jgi:YesN/AraC family two-component response regulator
MKTTQDLYHLKNSISRSSLDLVPDIKEIKLDNHSAKELKVLTHSLDILYVEDDETLLKPMQSSLSKLFDKTFIAVNGKEALKIFEKEHIDIVITDINMPMMNGLELIQALNNSSKKTPAIVVLSAYDDSNLLKDLINIGVTQFIQKPVDKQVMINTLYKACYMLYTTKIISNYESQLKEELLNLTRKNRVLQEKTNQLAVEKNKNFVHEVNENNKDTKTSTPTGQYREEYLEQFKLGKEDNSAPKREQKNYFEELLSDDIDELADLSAELENAIYLLHQNKKLNSNYLAKIAPLYQRYAMVLNAYSEFYQVGIKLSEFSEAILLLEDKFAENLEKGIVYIESLQSTLYNFYTHIWLRPASNPRFYNASLISDICLITDFLEGSENDMNEIDFFED